MKKAWTTITQNKKWLFYPWSLWKLCALWPQAKRRAIRNKQQSRQPLTHTYALQAALYLFFGFPATVIITGEIVITLNEIILPEQANYHVQSDFSAGSAKSPLLVPGPRIGKIPAVPPHHQERYHDYLVKLFSPVIIHKISTQPKWDIPVLFDYDGNSDPRDNVINQQHFPNLTAGIHGELTAEAEDSYYFTYSLYHIKDYDHPIREFLTHWTYHDNDNEGLHLRVDKASMRVVEVETWFHNRFLLFNHTNISSGSEPVHGKIHTEDNTHIIVYAQSQGHGVRLAQNVDQEQLRKNVKVMRYRNGRLPVLAKLDRNNQFDVTYELDNFDAWYSQARGPFGHEDKGTSIFAESFVIGKDSDGKELRIGRFLAGKDYAKGSWSRPKPMWSWDDGWDEIPVLIWHFFPSHSFSSHAGSTLSHNYLFNRPSQKIFMLDGNELFKLLDLKTSKRDGDKWRPLRKRGGQLSHDKYWKALRKQFVAYINYLFQSLG